MWLLERFIPGTHEVMRDVINCFYLPLVARQRYHSTNRRFRQVVPFA